MRGVNLISHRLNAHEDADPGASGEWQKAELLLGNDSNYCGVSRSSPVQLSDIPDLIHRKLDIHTLEAGRDTGSNAKWLIRRSCRCVPWRVLEISFNFCSSFPDIICDEGGATRLSTFADSISSLTEAKRTAGEPGFWGSGLEVVFWSDAVKDRLLETTAYGEGREVKTWRN